MQTLRGYQAQLLELIRAEFRAGHRSVLAVMPTGAGKGTTLAAMAYRAAARGNRVFILVHRGELVADLSRRLHLWGVDHGIIQGGRSMDLAQSVQIASVQTLVRRLDRVPAPDLIIQDEAHHAHGGNTWGRILSAFPHARLIGKTATPQRLDGKGLGIKAGGYFEAMVVGPDAAWLTDNGFLAPARTYCPPMDERISAIDNPDTQRGLDEAEEMLHEASAMGDAIDHYRRLIAPIYKGTAIAFTTSCAHADGLAEAFRDAGIPAAQIRGGQSREERAQLLRDLGDGSLKVLTSCEVISEGVDIPSVTGAILHRPTGSLSVYLQQCGRVLRPCEGKPYAVICDHVGNTAKHGLVTDERQWSLEGRKKKKGSAAAPVKICQTCFSAVPSLSTVCPVCGAPFLVAKREFTEVDGELQEFTREQAKQLAIAKKTEVSRARSREDLERLAQIRGYKPGWVDHIMRSRGTRSYQSIR